MAYAPAIGVCPLCGGTKSPFSTVCRDCYRGILSREGRTNTRAMKTLVAKALDQKGGK